MRCVPTYEVVTSQVTLTSWSEFRVTVPAGKKPIGAGWSATQSPTSSNTTGPQAFKSHPDGQDWVFEFSAPPVAGGFDMTLYVVCAEV